MIEKAFVWTMLAFVVGVICFAILENTMMKKVNRDGMTLSQYCYKIDLVDGILCKLK